MNMFALLTAQAVLAAFSAGLASYRHWSPFNVGCFVVHVCMFAVSLIHYAKSK